jgi:hypothetical protein
MIVGRGFQSSPYSVKQGAEFSFCLEKGIQEGGLACDDVSTKCVFDIDGEATEHFNLVPGEEKIVSLLLCDDETLDHVEV